jgi:uncharacterized protein YndB with AHSA1/START domain
MTMSTPKHVHEIYIRTTPEKLWSALTDGAFTRKYFFGTAPKSTWKPGAALTWHGEKGEPMVEGKVIEFDPPRRLAFTWSAVYSEETKADRPSRVTFTVEPKGATCKLSVLHDDFDGDTATYKSTGRGWSVVLSAMKTLLETGEPMPLPPMG